MCCMAQTFVGDKKQKLSSPHVSNANVRGIPRTFALLTCGLESFCFLSPTKVCAMQHIQPPAQGLYDPRDEHDACGVGFVVDLKNRKSHAIVENAIQVLQNLYHRGACGCEANTGDGAGILLQIPDNFLQQECKRLKI